jgi:hypothetical protein
MYIFLDESGAFIPPPTGRPKVSAVVALVIPHQLRDEISKRFGQLRDSWGRGTDEVKGSAATAAEVSQVINLLSEYDGVFAEGCVIDTGQHTAEDVRALRESQAAMLDTAVTPQHHPALRDEVARLAERIRALPEQLLLQMFPLILSIERVIRSAVIFHAVRMPAELGEFHWVVDAKNQKITDFEDLWTTLMTPFLHAVFLRNPTDLIETGDYSYFAEFNADVSSLPPELKEMLEGEPTPTDLKRVMRDRFEFRSSHEDNCLQIVDILSAALTRALNQRLDIEGWGDLGRLFIRRRSAHSVRMVLMTADASRRGEVLTARNYHGYVMERLDAKAKSMLP